MNSNGLARSIIRQEGRLSGNKKPAATGAAVVISAMLAAFVSPCLAARATSQSENVLLGCWSKIFSPDEVEAALNPEAPSLRPSFEICFLRTGEAATYAIIPIEREGLNETFRWRLIRKSRLVTDSVGECRLTLEDDGTITLKAITSKECAISGKFNKKCSHTDDITGECKQ